MKLLQWLQRAGASVFFLGYIPLMPGTIGSALIAGALWYLQRYRHIALTPQVWWLCALALIVVSVLLSSGARHIFGHEDPKQVIIDECAGQFITYFFVPLTLNSLILGFLLFRFFDIVKPYPIYKMEELEGGIGITMDDVVAGVFANVSLMVVVWGYHVVKAAL
ncbi:MAG TPA: phosphatidylglycerophosphatase A [Chitinivibrionales bacterium]